MTPMDLVETGPLTPCRCFCSACCKDHELVMTPQEFKAMVAIPGAIRKDGKLGIACDACRPFKYSGKK